VQGIAAVVNDDIVSTGELAERIRLLQASTNLPSDPETSRRLEQQVLRAMIDEKLQRQEAQRLNVTVADQEVDDAVRQLADRNRLTPQQLDQFLIQRGSSLTVLRRQLAAQIGWYKIIGREIRPKVVVTEDQVEFAVKSVPPTLGDREVLLSEILLPADSPQQEARVVADAQRIVLALRGGGNFAALARQVSASPSAESGGDLGWLPTKALNDTLRAALSTVQPGQITEPIRTPNGIQILMVRDARAESGPATPVAVDAATRNRIRDRLVDEQTQRLANRYLRDLRRNAFVDIRI
jgi:peptidyl-prolyl cis-trans isomerase SurA